MNYLCPYLHMLVKLNSCINTSNLTFIKEIFFCDNIYKIREHLPLEDEPESLLELPELLDLPTVSPFGSSK